MVVTRTAPPRMAMVAKARSRLLTRLSGATAGPSHTTRMACSKDSNACEPAHRASTRPMNAAVPLPSGLPRLPTMSLPTTGNWPSTESTISSLLLSSKAAWTIATNTMSSGNSAKKA